nr:hypothetical protein [Pedobacter glucosidilyticus]
MTGKTGHNSSYKKLAVQWLNEALCFVSSSVVADSFRLRNRQLLVAAKRCMKFCLAFTTIQSMLFMRNSNTKSAASSFAKRFAENTFSKRVA